MAGYVVENAKSFIQREVFTHKSFCYSRNGYDVSAFSIHCTSSVLLIFTFRNWYLLGWIIMPPSTFGIGERENSWHLSEDTQTRFVKILV